MQFDDMNDSASELHKIRAWVHTSVSRDRAAHIFSVENECNALAARFGMSKADTARLRIAALLHDCTKECTTEEQILLCRRFGIACSEEAIASPKILHAWTGAAFARSLFPDAVDDLVYHAIFAHTTGSVPMNLHDRLLYLADYIEPTRSYDDCIMLRRHFYGALDALTEDAGAAAREEVLRETLVRSFDMTISGLLRGGRPIFPGTVRARNALLS